MFNKMKNIYISVLIICYSLLFKTSSKIKFQYSPLICYLRRTVATAITLQMDAVTVDVTHVEVDLRFHLAKIAIYRSSAGVVTSWATG